MKCALLFMGIFYFVENEFTNELNIKRADFNTNNFFLFYSCLKQWVNILVRYEAHFKKKMLTVNLMLNDK